MTEETIIDGINVSGCEHHLSTGYCQLQMIFQGMVLKLPFGKHLECNLCDKDCYYKQLKRLEQENKELKEMYRLSCLKCEYKNTKADVDKYRSALEEIREIAKFNQFYNPEDLLINGDIGQIQDLKMTEIYNRINEVLE